MSGQPPNNAGTSLPRPTTNGNTPGNMAHSSQQRGNEPQVGGNNNAQGGNMSQQNLNSIVLEYLSKKGYSKSEAMLRTESAARDVEGKPLSTSTEEPLSFRYSKVFSKSCQSEFTMLEAKKSSRDIMRTWIEDNLDIYKADARRLQWPVYVYSFLKIVANDEPQESRRYFQSHRELFEAEHPDDLRALEPISLKSHSETNETARIYLSNRYRVRMSSMAFNNLIMFLESKEKEGASLLLAILQNNLHVVTFERSADNQHSLAKILSRAQMTEVFPAEDEGIPGHNPGSANTEQVAGSSVLTRVKLGPLPMEPEFMADVRADLEEEDTKNPPREGQSSLTQTFEQQIKREESEDAPTRAELPLPITTARDVMMEVQKVKENRERFRIESRTGGVGPGVSVVMYTFHNTFDSITCLDFSQDNALVAAGTDQSYLRVWTLNGEALPSLGDASSTGSRPSASRRLIGHSGCVYSVSFSPSATQCEGSNSTDGLTASKFLLSCAADKTVRLWSLETWTCLVIYRGHDDIVWDVKWGPFGHYFLTGSHDKTARLWATSEISWLRVFVGHDKDVDTVCFHPNNAYVFTGSCDRMVRMWKVTDAVAVRMFTGHTGNITSLACSPSGKLLASADDSGTIIVWDLAPGKLLKRMRGHGKGGIWSLSWSVESTVLTSCGMDGTVRIWDIAVPNDANGQGRVLGEGGSDQRLDGNAQSQVSTGTGPKKRGKEVIVTSDQISAFPTKKSPVYKVQFTRQNLIIAGGAYMP